MYDSVQTCKHCGANLTLDDLRRTNCPYCQTVYPHHSQAAQHAQVAGQVMNQMMAQQAQIQNQWRGAFGVGPMPQGPPGGPPPPGVAGMPGAPPGMPGANPYGHAYGNPHMIAQAHVAHAMQTSRTITMVVLAIVLGTFLLVGAIVAIAFLG
jgi:hypothetical protein